MSRSELSSNLPVEITERIKNIDNIIQNHLETISLYKKSLAGILIEFQQKIAFYLSEMDSNNL